MQNYAFTQDNIRLNRVVHAEDAELNWLFFPGGPGGDSSILNGLIEAIDVPGNITLVDLPGNGTHAVEQPYDYDQWLELFIPFIKSVKNPVFVGHSFGGMLPLLFPELEDLLLGCVIMNTTPGLWLEEAARLAKENNLPDLTEDMAAFNANPSQETFEQAMQACMPYYFPKETLAKGAEILGKAHIVYQAAVWWQHKAIEMNYNAQWIPQSVETLIIGGEYDYITPYSMFAKDERFERENITKTCITGAGHAPWVEKPERVKALFSEFAANLAQRTRA